MGESWRPLNWVTQVYNYHKERPQGQKEKTMSTCFFNRDGKGFEIIGDFVVCSSCGVTWAALHLASDPMDESCLACSENLWIAIYNEESIKVRNLEGDVRRLEAELMEARKPSLREVLAYEAGMEARGEA